MLGVPPADLSVTTAGKMSLPQDKFNYHGFCMVETNICKKEILHHINSLVKFSI